MPGWRSIKTKAAFYGSIISDAMRDMIFFFARSILGKPPETTPTVFARLNIIELEIC